MCILRAHTSTIAPYNGHACVSKVYQQRNHCQNHVNYCTVGSFLIVSAFQYAIVSIAKCVTSTKGESSRQRQQEACNSQY